MSLRIRIILLYTKQNGNGLGLTEGGLGQAGQIETGPCRLLVTTVSVIFITFLQSVLVFVPEIHIV